MLFQLEKLVALFLKQFALENISLCCDKVANLTQVILETVQCRRIRMFIC